MAAPRRFARSSVVPAGHPRRRPARNAAENASPAPTESSAGPGSGWPGATRADTERPRRVKSTAPDAPRVTTSREHGKAANRASARPRVPGPRRRSVAASGEELLFVRLHGRRGRERPGERLGPPPGGAQVHVEKRGDSPAGEERRESGARRLGALRERAEVEQAGPGADERRARRARVDRVESLPGRNLERRPVRAVDDADPRRAAMPVDLDARARETARADRAQDISAAGVRADARQKAGSEAEPAEVTRDVERRATRSRSGGCLVQESLAEQGDRRRRGAARAIRRQAPPTRPAAAASIARKNGHTLAGSATRWPRNRVRERDSLHWTSRATSFPAVAPPLSI